IRDRNVTGVQTCALPIYEQEAAQGSELSRHHFLLMRRATLRARHHRASRVRVNRTRDGKGNAPLRASDARAGEDFSLLMKRFIQIGRASCRERVEELVVG